MDSENINIDLGCLKDPLRDKVKNICKVIDKKDEYGVEKARESCGSGKFWLLISYQPSWENKPVEYFLDFNKSGQMVDIDDMVYNVQGKVPEGTHSQLGNKDKGKSLKQMRKVAKKFIQDINYTSEFLEKMGISYNKDMIINM